MKYYYINWKWPMILGVDEEAEYLELSYIAAGNTKFTTILENSLTIADQIKYILSVKPEIPLLDN